MGGSVTDLEKENARLTWLAQRDWLTGLYNRGTTEQKVNECIEKYKTGTLFVIDVDNFKKLNDRYGHITGDHLLQKIAQVLSSMVFRNDILGRVGGDEFVIYMPVEQTMEFIEERARQIRERLREMKLLNMTITKLSVTVGGSLYRPGDTYQILFDRADQRLLSDKHIQREQGMEEAKVSPWSKKGIAIDMKLIREEMSEQQLIPGAYCQDYETFKSIYRFVERRMRRTKDSAYIILLTLTDGQGEFPGLEEREEKMGRLKEVVQGSLRMGDVFTQYSSCQYLVMLLDLNAEDADMVASRISEEFYQQIPGQERDVLLHHSYPMRPAGQSDTP